MAACGRVDEAVEQARTHSEGDTWYAVSHVARLLAGDGRLEEAVTALSPHPTANSHDLAEYLIDLGRVEQAVAVLHQHRPQPPARSTGPWHETPPF
ncbi:hypothetical protein [Streptomyces sp. JV178]|uniref:hypothetical protein n=1 Tax=Streptomyces sp. JV178 TaxID=858632 RepID=UPI00211DC847|nr:hypothetical protein [Streptomyces sp. JV178]